MPPFTALHNSRRPRVKTLAVQDLTSPYFKQKLWFNSCATFFSTQKILKTTTKHRFNQLETTTIHVFYPKTTCTTI